MSSKLFLKMNDGVDPLFLVVDEDNRRLGQGYEIPDAISSARKTTNADIECNAGIITTSPASEFIQDKDELIECLAEIGGMKVTTMFDDNLNFKGYSLDLKED